MDVWVSFVYESQYIGYSLICKFQIKINITILLVNSWQFIAVGCNNKGSRPSVICYAQTWWTHNSTFYKNEIYFYNSTYINKTSDQMYIGDTDCSFVGNLKIFRVIVGSSAFIDRKSILCHHVIIFFSHPNCKL